MKLSLIFVLLLLTVTFGVFGQAPEKMSYQAIIRAQDNSLVSNSNIGLKVILRQGSVSGAIVYQETQTATTNSNGLVSLQIGTGTVATGSFSAIAWENGPYYIETQVDVTGKTNYNIIGVSQLLSVPYALHAKTADRLVGTSSTATTSTGTVTAYKATIISFTSSRSIASTDVNNTIECTKSSTLTLTSGFNAMVVGDTLNLEAHNGAVLTVQAGSGVTLNYNSSGIANFTSTAGNVRFGMLRKIAVNAYIISGQ